MTQEELTHILSLMPSDDDIKKMFTTEHSHYLDGRYYKIRLDRIQGAKIMRDLIVQKLKNNNHVKH